MFLQQNYFKQSPILRQKNGGLEHVTLKKTKFMAPFYGFNCLKARAVRYILGIFILVFQNLLAKLNMQNM